MPVNILTQPGTQKSEIVVQFRTAVTGEIVSGVRRPSKGQGAII